jgi:putative DNA primase/helicase
VWSFKDRVLLPHSPSNYLTWKLDRDYSPIDAKWDLIDKFLHTITNGDRSLKNVLIAACGAVLQGRADLHKALYLFGSGRNGKGAFLTLLELLVGEQNSQPSSLESICENRFEMANFYNKRLVVCADEERKVRGFSNFKKLTGGDVLRGEDKGIKAFSFRYQGMVILASNDPVFVGDASYGLSERLIPIPFAVKIPKADRRNLTEDFNADLPAFTTYLLNLDRDWVSDTLKQANDLKAINDLAWELTIQTDSIAAFYEEKLIYEPGATVMAKDIYGEYKHFCSDVGFSAKHQNNFCSSLVRLLVDKLEKDVSSRKTMKGKIINGLRLRTVLDPIDDGMTTMTTMTTQTEKIFISESSPKPPTIDRPIPRTTKVDENVEYLIVDGEVKWLEIYFYKHAIGKDWKNQIFLWGCQTSDLERRDKRPGHKWLLIVKGLTTAHLEQILSADLTQSPRQPSHR